MTQYDFDRRFDRRGTNSVKWEFRVTEAGAVAWDAPHAEHPADRVIPMWVADMDFRVADPIVDALHRRVEHGVFGYGMRNASYLEAVAGWFERRHGWRIEHDWIVPTPGVVPGLHLVVRRFTEPGDRILIQRPVYHPFTNAAVNNGREVVSNSLVFDGETYRMDFKALERQVADPKVKVALLCSPHNPVGRIWDANELRRFDDICAAHDVLVVADEIHCDLVLPGQRFTPYASLGGSILSNAIICTAPSKTFNLAGLQTANLIVPDEGVRDALRAELRSTGLYAMSPLGIAGLEAAYRHGDEWLDQALAYIAGNMALLGAACGDRLPGVKMIEPQATYLAWLDCRALGLDDEALGRLMMDEAKLYLDEGHIFGPEGSGFVRINVACPRALLEETIDRLVDAIASTS